MGMVSLFPESPVKIPARDELLNYLGISTTVKRQYVLADRKNGVYLAEAYNSRSGDYKINEFNTFKDFTVYEDGKYLNISKAKNCVIYPYGIRYNFDDGVYTEFMLNQNESGIVIIVKGNKDKNYAVIPSFSLTNKSENLKFENNDKEKILYITNSDPKNEIKNGAVIYNNAAFSPVYSMADYAASEDGSLLKTGIYGGRYESKGSVKIIINFGSDKPMLADVIKKYNNPDKLSENIKDFFYDMLKRCYVKTDNDLFDKALMWSIVSGNSMVNTRFSGTGIYAGFPWFQQNWGRDTFISLPGVLLVTGRFDESKAVLKTFSDYQNKDDTKKMYGRIPNRVQGKSIIYNTTDGTPFMIREAYEYLQYTGDTEYAKAMYEVAKLAAAGAEKNYVDKDGFLTHDDPDTWMDARISGKQPWSARGNRAVEIEALWYNQLLLTSKLAALAGDNKARDEYLAKAQKVKESFNKVFWNDKQKMLFDRLREDNSQDSKVRPNQYLAYTVPDEPIMSDDKAALMVKNATERLVFPYGVISLETKDKYFHPYHENPMYHKDSAYHNGTIWGWNAGPAISSITDFGYQDFAFALTENLSDQIINQGCAGSMSENMDAIPGKDGKVKLTGTYSQAWSVSEFTRNFYQSYAGIKPRLLDNKVIVKPKFPVKMGSVYLVQPVAKGNVELFYDKNNYSLTLNNLPPLNIDFAFTMKDGSEYTVTFNAVSGKTYKLSSKDNKFYLDDSELTAVKSKDSYKNVIKELKFANNKISTPATLKKKDFLKEIILGGKYK